MIVNLPAEAFRRRTRPPRDRVVGTGVSVRQPDAGWNEAIAERACATAFHSAEWAATLQACYGFPAQYLELWQEQSEPVLLPVMEVTRPLAGRCGVSLPFSDCCEPLGITAANAREVRAALLGYGRQRGWRALEIRGGSKLLSEIEPCERFVTHTLDLLNGPDRLWQGCSSAMRRAVRKARAAGVIVRKDSSDKGMRAFYRLQCDTRRKHGLPPQPWRFFALLHEHMIENNLGDLYLADFQSHIVAGAVFLRMQGAVTFKYGASDHHYLDLRANNLVIWQAIADYAAAGAGELNFGRTEPDNAGLRRFKTGYGAVEQPLNYYRFDYRTGVFAGQKAPSVWFKVARQIFRRLPVPLAQMLGTLVYRHAA